MLIEIRMKDIERPGEKDFINELYRLCQKHGYEVLDYNEFTGEEVIIGEKDL